MPVLSYLGVGMAYMLMAFALLVLVIHIVSMLDGTDVPVRVAEMHSDPLSLVAVGDASGSAAATISVSLAESAVKALVSGKGSAGTVSKADSAFNIVYLMPTMFALAAITLTITCCIAKYDTLARVAKNAPVSLKYQTAEALCMDTMDAPRPQSPITSDKPIDISAQICPTVIMPSSETRFAVPLHALSAVGVKDSIDIVDCSGRPVFRAFVRQVKGGRKLVISIAMWFVLVVLCTFRLSGCFASAAHACANGGQCYPTCTAAVDTLHSISTEVGTRSARSWDGADYSLLQHNVQHATRKLKALGDSKLWWDPDFRSEPIYVEPYWGLSNRLRTMTGAYAAGRAVGRNVIVIWKPGEFCMENITELFENLPTASMAPDSSVTLFPNGQPGCEYGNGIGELASVGSHVPVYIRACDFNVPETRGKRFMAYHAMQLNMGIGKEIATLIKQLRSLGNRSIGVHIRQGSADDVQHGNFFGKFEGPLGGLTELPCCSQNAPKWACPEKASPLQEYASRMKQKASSYPGEKVIFFVASDRPSCIRDLVHEMTDAGFIVLHRPLDGDDGTGPDDAKTAMLDMFSLAACSELLDSQSGSSWGQEINMIHKDGSFMDEVQQINLSFM